MSTPLIFAVCPSDLRVSSGSRSWGGATAAAGVASWATTAGATEPAPMSNVSASAQIANADRLDMVLPPLVTSIARNVLTPTGSSSAAYGGTGAALAASPAIPHRRERLESGRVGPPPGNPAAANPGGAVGARLSRTFL